LCAFGRRRADRAPRRFNFIAFCGFGFAFDAVKALETEGAGQSARGEMSLQTLAVISLKGGSGKTTVAAHLALAAHLRGIETLLVDTDPQQSSTDILSAREAGGPRTVTSTGGKLLAAQIAASGLKKDLMIIDTAAGAVEDVSEALVLADFSLLVVRPTLLDLAGLARTLTVVKRLGKPSAVVLNQAPVPREGAEAPLVKRAMLALEYMKAPAAPAILRQRAIYQTALETGRSVEECRDAAAAREIAELWDYVAGEIGLAEDDVEA
jgi:chromosome partitioning protein